ncbi:MAG: hypothetical protein JSW10_10410 [Pseudomonadota bacterium]|nr:MAG: hypothetical protein JSW10_10410 [Pseudomonadota bacterium]
MSEKKGLGLGIPERSKPAPGAFDLRPRRVEQWIDALPKANLGETARLVFGALVECNRQTVSYQERFRFLEAMRESVFYVTTGMKKHFVGVSFPLPEKSQKVAAITREIYAELATGYKIAIEDFLTGHHLLPDNRLLTTLLHRAVSCIGRELLTSYQIYAPHRSAIWSELHTLYRFAESRRLHNTPVADTQHRYVAKSTITDEYTRLLLLALSSPYCLRHGEINKIYENIERWAGRCALEGVADIQTLPGHFAVDLESDHPPRFLAFSVEGCDPEACRIVDTAELAEGVRTELQLSKDVGNTTLTGIDMQRPDLSHSLLRRLLIAWGVVPKRTFSRSDKQEPVEVALGLSATHQTIANVVRTRRPSGTGGDTVRKDKFDQPARFESITIRDVNEPEPDVWEMVYTPHEDADAEPEDTAPKSDARRDSALQASIAWSIVNESAGGYCLRTTGGSGAKVQVGELVGIRRSGDGHTWKWGIGVVRWMKFSQQHALLLGVEMLTPDAAAVGLRIAAASAGNGNHFQRTLMLPQLTAINKPATLVTPPVPYREGSKVIVNILGKELLVELTRQLENTGLFAQFQFEVLDANARKQQPAETQPAADEWLQDKDFGKIWTLI